MKQVVVACLFSVLLALSANADIIYFKDGLKTICQDKAWEENGQVKCEYGGWTLSYKKSDVLRILSTTPPKQPAPSQKKPQVQTKTKPPRSGTQKQNQSKSEGLVFYDPRRPYIYWTDKTTKHKSFNEAINVLAQKYERTPEWIKQYMGQTNDLAEIHQNLQTRIMAETSE